MIQYPNTVRLLLHQLADIPNPRGHVDSYSERDEILHGQMSHSEEFDMCRGLDIDMKNQDNPYLEAQ